MNQHDSWGPKGPKKKRNPERKPDINMDKIVTHSGSPTYPSADDAATKWKKYEGEIPTKLYGIVEYLKTIGGNQEVTRQGIALRFMTAYLGNPETWQELNDDGSAPDPEDMEFMTKIARGAFFAADAFLSVASGSRKDGE